ncbi:MAG: di-heme oxidoredictase family protein, partial [Rubripirellula sp.]
VRQSALTKFDLPSRSSGSYGKSKVSESVKSRLSKSRKNTSLSITDLASKSESVNEFSRRPAASSGAGRSKSNEHWELGIRRKLSPSETSQEWRTPPLWGLRDSAPYMHDGRAETILESISLHGGEGAGSRDRFLGSSLRDRNDLLMFLNTFVAPSNVPEANL